MKEISTEQKVELFKPEPTIFDKYRHLIYMAQSGYLRGYSHPEIMEILRYVEGRIGHNFPINTQCGTCLLDLIMMFSRFE